MSFRTIAATVTGCLALAVAATAQQTGDAAPTKIAFVDVKRALVSIEEGKAKRKELQDWARPKEEELQRLGKEIADLQTELNAKRAAANEDALAELNRRLVAKQREAEDKQRVAQRDLEERQATILRGVGEKLQAVITQYSDANRFTAVFILEPDNVAYLAASADITDQVVKLYNEKYPLQAKPAAPPAK
jgi:outer membrane protein